MNAGVLTRTMLVRKGLFDVAQSSTVHVALLLSDRSHHSELAARPPQRVGGTRLQEQSKFAFNEMAARISEVRREADAERKRRIAC